MTSFCYVIVLNSITIVTYLRQYMFMFMFICLSLFSIVSFCDCHFVRQINFELLPYPEEELKSEFNGKVAWNNGLSNFPVELRL